MQRCWFADLFRGFLSSTILWSLPTVLPVLLITSFFTLSPSICLIAKQQWQPWQICALAHTVSHLTLANPLPQHKHTCYTTKCPAGLQFMILNPTPPQNVSLVSTPSLRWQEGSVQLDGTVVFLSWGLWSFALHPPNQRLPCQPGEGAGSLLDLAPFPLPIGTEARVFERYDAYLCGAVWQLGQGGGPAPYPPASLP